MGSVQLIDSSQSSERYHHLLFFAIVQADLEEEGALSVCILWAPLAVLVHMLGR